jgi:hypothetical protein
MMSSFSYVYVGNVANDGTGTALRDAFAIIDANFANIASGNATITTTAPVQTVANRTGNINLTVNDVAGAASIGYVNSLSLAGNAYVNLTLANVQALINSLSNVDVSVVETTVSALQQNVGSIFTHVRTLDANIGSQSIVLAPLPSAVATLQTQASSITACVSAAFSTLSSQASEISVLTTGNAYIQSEVIALQANIAAANIVITGVSAAWQANAVGVLAQQASQLSAIDLVASKSNSTNANVAAANLAIVTIENSLSSLSANLTAANAAIVTANTAVVDYFNDIIGPIQANTGNLTAILNLIGTNDNNIILVNDNIALINSNITAANAAIVTANTAMKAYVDSRASTFGNANIAVYLPSYSGNIGNVTTNSVTTTTGVYWPNGAPYAPNPITVSDTPPTINSVGQLWWDSTGGSAYVSYQNDWIDLIPGGYSAGGGASAQWAQVETLVNIDATTSSATTTMTQSLDYYIATYNEFFVKIQATGINSPTFPVPSKLLPLVTIDSNEYYGLGTSGGVQFAINWPNFSNTTVVITGLQSLHNSFGATLANVLIYAR